MLLSSFILSCCNQIQNTTQQRSEIPDTVQSQPETEEADQGGRNGDEQIPTEEYGRVSDTVMTSGNHVVFFMRNGEWANEIGAEQAANDFTYNATEAMDSLERNGFKASFLIGDQIRIGLENGTTFKIKNEDCVMGVVLVSTGKQPHLACGRGSSADFWNYFKAYYNIPL